MLPLAKQPLAPVTGFIASQQSAFVVCNLITAALLYRKFNIVRTRALPGLTEDYLFTAFIALTHAHLNRA